MIDNLTHVECEILNNTSIYGTSNRVDVIILRGALNRVYVNSYPSDIGNLIGDIIWENNIYGSSKLMSIIGFALISTIPK